MTFDADLRRLYDELSQLDRHVREFDRRLQETRLVKLCAACQTPYAIGGVCHCDVDAARALGRYQAARETAA